jgi:transposase
MWTTECRERYQRKGLRYPSDLTDAEWALIEPMIPPAKRGGRRRSVNLREVVQGLLYILETGCGWRHLPKDFPPRSTVWEYFDLWDYYGTLVRIHETLYLAVRKAEGREASPTAAIIDSQTVKSAEKGGLSARKRAMTRARRPKASSVMCWSTRSA